MTLQSKAGNLIFTSVDRYHQIDIANIDSPAEQYKFLIQKYQGENIRRLHQLCRSILNMAQVSTLLVDSKVSRLKTDNQQIGQQNMSMKLSDHWLSEILILSIDEGFETEISLIQDKDPPLTFDQIHRRLKKKTSLETPPESINAARRQPLTDSTNNSRPISDPSICFGCKIPFNQLPNNHRRVVCKIYLSTPEVEAWKKKSFYTDKKIAYEKMFGAITDNMASANANFRVNVAKGLVNRYSQDSDAYSSTESIASGYLCVASINSEPSETKKSQLENLTKLSWLLDTAASEHITNRKEVFEKSIQSSNQQIIVANGQMIHAQGIGSILIPWESSQAKPKLLRIRDVL
ncbi:hypothetical protein K3495_g12830 [Podosphaera aphanis]|nr:hypothetical protein K3495_g12830 [Podosphaera aphanis]